MEPIFEIMNIMKPVMFFGLLFGIGFIFGKIIYK